MNKNNNKPAELLIFLQHGMDSSGTPELQDSGSSFITDLNLESKRGVECIFSGDQIFVSTRTTGPLKCACILQYSLCTSSLAIVNTDNMYMHVILDLPCAK